MDDDNMGISDRSLGPGNLWLLIIGIGFLFWGILAVTIDAPGGPWMFIPGGILFVVAISQIATYRYNRGKVLGALRSYQRISLRQLAKELSMKEKEVKDIIIDYRSQGVVKASFDPETGDVIVLDVGGFAPTSAAVATPGAPAAPTSGVEIISSGEKTPAPSLQDIRDQGYCPYCGSRIQSDDRFCITCGSALE